MMSATRLLSGLLAAMFASVSIAERGSAQAGSAGASAASANAAAVPLTMDPAVRIGTLPNGFKYYIRQNAWPLNRAELRLVVNAGSVLEDENQRGLAHFLEHMAFNGTKHFPKFKLVDYLQSIGMGFGADINAATNFDETTYMLTIPTDSVGFLHTGLQILQDWAENVTIDSLEVERERKVIIEEWRSRRGLQMRLADQQLPALYNGSKYGERMPIGLVKVIETAPPSQLRRYYDEWYRPDLMAVVVVGDINVDSVEKDIKAMFGGIKTRAVNPRPRDEVVVPVRKGTSYLLLTDPEQQATQVSVMFAAPNEKTRTTADMRRDMIASLYANFINSRLGEIAAKPDAPFISASTGFQGIGRNAALYSVGARVKEGEAAKGLQAAFAEVTRAKKYGFTQSELDRARTNTLKGYEDAWARRDKIPSSQFVDDLVNNYLTGDPVVSLEESIKFGKDIINSITLADINAMAGKWVSDSSRLFMTVAPKKDGVPAPDSASLASAYTAGLNASVTAYAENVSSDALLAKLPTPGKVVSETRDSATGIVSWKLSNGVRVLVKQTDFTPDAVSISGSRPGGVSLAPDSLVVPASTASQVVSAGGVGDYDLIALRKRLAGKSVNFGANIGAYSEGVNVSATPKDLETALQLMYLGFTRPRADTGMFKTMVQNAHAGLLNKASSPDAAFSDTIQLTMSQHHPRAPIMTNAFVDKMDLKKSMAFYKERMSDVGGYTFVIVGVMSPDSLKPLVERYIGGLPAGNGKHAFVDVGIAPPKGVVTKEVRRGKEPRSTSVTLFTGSAADTPDNQARLNAVRGVLDLRLLQTLRQKLGGTYTPQLGASLTHVPRPEYVFQIIYSAEPQRVPELQQAVMAELEKFKAEGPTEDELHKVKEESRRGWETAVKNNAFWSQMIAHYTERGWPLANILKGDQATQSLTATQVRDAARQFLNTKNYVQFSMFPEVMPQATPAATPAAPPATPAAPPAAAVK